MLFGICVSVNQLTVLQILNVLKIVNYRIVIIVFTLCDLRFKIIKLVCVEFCIWQILAIQIIC